LQPGPLLFVNNAPLVWSLIASLLVANFMLLVLNLPLVGLWVRLLSVPKPWLYGGILVFATLGTIGANGAMSGRLGPVPFSFELGLLLLFGLLGYVLRRFDYPIAPVVVGLILGPMAEQQLRRALAISQGDPSILVHSPYAIVLYSIAAIALLLPIYLRFRGRGEMLGQLAANED
jgi:putative tricarboxylic transport membrane protein